MKPFAGGGTVSRYLMGQLGRVLYVSQSSKAKDHATHLERQLSLCHDGNITALITEGCTIQQHLHHRLNQQPDTQLARSFSNLMFEGKTKAAIKLITGHKCGGLLKLNDRMDSNRVVWDVLLEKHTPAQLLFRYCLIYSVSEPPPIHLAYSFRWFTRP